MYQYFPSKDSLVAALLERESNAQQRVFLELGRTRCAASDLDVAALLVVRAFRYTTIPVVDEPFESEAARDVFVDELTDMLAAYLLLPRPWRETES